MVITDKDTFFRLTGNFQEIAPTQSYGWYSMNSQYHPEKIVFMVNDVNNPTIGCFGHIKKIGFIRMLLIEDERFIDGNSQKASSLCKFYSGIISMGFDIIETNSNRLFNFEYEIGMRQAGFLRPVGQFCFPNTKIIDLAKEVSYNQNWKRNIKKAADNNLSFQIIEKPGIKDIDDFLEIYSSMTKRKKLSFGLNSEQLLRLCSSTDFKLFFVAQNAIRLSTIIIHKSAEKAGLLFAATTEEALKFFASYFMYNELFSYLPTIGIESFDMEKVIPSTDDVNNVFLFKNGVKGTYVHLNGEWAWYKNSLYRVGMYFVKKYILKKREM